LIPVNDATGLDFVAAKQKITDLRDDFFEKLEFERILFFLKTFGGTGKIVSTKTKRKNDND